MVEPGWRAAVQLLEKILATIDMENVEPSLGLALVTVDAVETLLSRNLDLQQGLLDRLRQLALAAVRQGVELKARVQLAQMLGRIGDPRVVDDLNNPAAWVQVAAGTYDVRDLEVKKEYNEQRALTPERVTFTRPFLLSRLLCCLLLCSLSPLPSRRGTSVGRSGQHIREAHAEAQSSQRKTPRTSALCELCASA